LTEPVPSGFEWADYHALTEPVVSKKVADVLAEMNIYGLEIVEAIVRHPKDKNADPGTYWYLHIWNHINCLDRENSELDVDEDDEDEIWEIEELVLDEEVLEGIALEKRLMFVLGESISVKIVHKSVKEAIESVNPRGCRFFEFSEWNSDIGFA